MKNKIKEHIIETNHNHFNTHDIVAHSHNFKHLLSYDQANVLSYTTHNSSHLTKEALEIEKHPNNFNLEDGYKFNQSWRNFIHHLSVLSIYISILCFPFWLCFILCLDSHAKSSMILGHFSLNVGIKCKNIWWQIGIIDSRPPFSLWTLFWCHFLRNACIKSLVRTTFLLKIS